MDLGKGIRDAINRFIGKSIVDEKAVKELIKEIQRVLIASDVDVKLVSLLSKNIEKRALQEEKPAGITLREHVVKIVYDELTNVSGVGYEPRLDRHKVMLVGLYGSGKTTTAGKLALFYKKRGLKPLLIAADTDRPAAKEQLKQLSEKIGVDYFTSEGKSLDIVDKGVRQARQDVLIIDTAGRNAMEESLKKEIRDIHERVKPDEIFLVISADIGHIAKKQTQEFLGAVPVTGVFITKMDGSGKAGGALTAVAESGSRIAFIGTGEKLENIEIYDPKKFVSRLLGMPDLKSLLEKVEAVKEELELEEEFNFETLYKQLKAAKSMGPISSILQNMGFGNIPKELMEQGEMNMSKFEAIIQSMTKKERRDPELLRKSSSRIERIAKGSGTKVEDVRALVNQFFKMEKMMKKFQKDRGMRSKLERMMKSGKFSPPQ